MSGHAKLWTGIFLESRSLAASSGARCFAAVRWRGQLAGQSIQWSASAHISTLEWTMKLLNT
eukprot:8599825-Pyramimonas_sp.AAC.1